MTTKSYPCGTVNASIHWYKDDAQFAHIQPTANFTDAALIQLRNKLYVRSIIVPTGMNLRSSFQMAAPPQRDDKPLVRKHLFLGPIMETLKSNHFEDGITDEVDGDKVPVIKNGHEIAAYFYLRIMEKAVELNKNKNLTGWECPFYSYVNAMNDVIGGDDDIEELDNPPPSMKEKHPMMNVNEGDDDCLIHRAPIHSIDIGQPVIKTEEDSPNGTKKNGTKMGKENEKEKEKKSEPKILGIIHHGNCIIGMEH